MKKINSELIREMISKARASNRKRVNYNFHTEMSDTLQRMLNAMQPGTYLQPHKHQNPDKREVFIVLTGKFVVVQFDENGAVTDHMILDTSKNQFAAEMDARVYHTIICLAPNSVIYELKDGPYDPSDDKNFAPWAPSEGDEGCSQYLNAILTELNISL
ncbi:MAG: WbuC family cupin fold metalloprotein [Bacteroidales bacterium]|nr:WbuC family cupin fold metalloprotein [Bacteroidales bacterium]MCF8403316.1 WbuC family cupin fold metalloprotein [Bacteroidales bacterium]